MAAETGWQGTIKRTAATGANARDGQTANLRTVPDTSLADFRNLLSDNRTEWIITILWPQFTECEFVASESLLTCSSGRVVFSSRRSSAVSICDPQCSENS